MRTRLKFQIQTLPMKTMMTRKRAMARPKILIKMVIKTLKNAAANAAEVAAMRPSPMAKP